uniref:Uncharacterized protein LOC111124219 n=1 Tax=Crassostrea virginica TaxID=6565 RepID=A0A8B8D539_CRAVI|nr:uncharacterized protein LOC111124219 [Crassostrea virginica]
MKSIIIISNDTSYNLQHPAPADPAPAAAAPADPAPAAAAPADPAPAAAAPADPAPLAPLDPAPESDIEEEDQDHGDVNMDDLTYMADMSFEVPNPVHEESIQEDVIEDIPPQTNTPGPEYEVVDLGTSRGNKKLVDKRGYQYTLKKSKGEGHGYWRCTKRGKINPCPATVMQDGGNFKEGVRAHNHAAEPGVHLSVKIKSEIKETSTQNVFSQSAPQIVEDVLRRLADAEAPPASRPKPANLTRAAQRVRQSMRPKDPKDLNFERAYNERGDVHHCHSSHRNTLKGRTTTSTSVSRQTNSTSLWTTFGANGFDTLPSV